MATTSAPPKLDPHDVLGLDHLLGDEDRMLRDSVRRWVGDRVLPEIGGWFEEGILPRELAKEVGDLGLLGMHLEGYGCAGASATAYGVACRELEFGDSGLRSLVSVQGSLAMFPIWKFGSEEQKEQWLPGMAAGDLIGCFGLTEPDFGSEPSGMRTTAKRDGDDWVLNGSKQWITNGGIADVAVVWARHDDDIRGFVIPTDTKGFEVSNIHHKLSLRASVSSELVARRRAPARRRRPARGQEHARAALVPERGALRDRVGRCRRRPRLLRVGARVRQDARAVRAADRRLPAHPAQARRHDARAPEGAAGGVAARAAQGRRRARPAAGQRRQAQQRPRGARGRARGAHDPRGQRHHHRVSDHAPRQQPRVGPHLRGHVRDPHARSSARR